MSKKHTIQEQEAKSKIKESVDIRRICNLIMLMNMKGDEERKSRERFSLEIG